MEWSLQAHKTRYTTDEIGAVGCSRVPHRRVRLKTLDVSKYLFGVSLIQVDSIAGCQILLIEVTVARAGFRRHKHEMSQYVRQRVTCWMQAGNFDRPLARLAVPDKCVSVGCSSAGAKIDVVGSFNRRSPSRLCIRRGWRAAWRSRGRFR